MSYNPILEDWTASKNNAFAMIRPWYHGGWVYATDGSAMVREPCGDEPDSVADTYLSFPNPKGIYDGNFETTPTPIPRPTPCPECEGAPSFRYQCSKCSHPNGGCDNCEDRGVVMGPKRYVLLARGYGVRVKYLMRLLRYKDVCLYLPKPLGPCAARFKIGETIEGRLMPVEVDKEDR